MQSVEGGAFLVRNVGCEDGGVDIVGVALQNLLADTVRLRAAKSRASDNTDRALARQITAPATERACWSCGSGSGSESQGKQERQRDTFKKVGSRCTCWGWPL